MAKIPDAVNRIRKAVVRITGESAGGTGVIVAVRKQMAYVLTTAQTVQGDRNKLRVTVRDRPQVRPTLNALDAEANLARLALYPGKFNAAALSTAESIRPGSEVFAVGYPYGAVGGTATVTTGIVSAVGPHPRHPHGAVIQTDAAIYNGMLGGPLFAANGKIVGILAFREDGNPESRLRTGMAFAIPATAARTWLETSGLSLDAPVANPRGKPAIDPPLEPPIPLTDITSVWREAFPSRVAVATEGGGGSGVVFRAEGGKAWIITNHHVIKGRKTIVVGGAAGACRATVLRRNAARDLAVLRVEGEGFRAARFAPPEALIPGSSVAVIGFPGGAVEGTDVVTRGVISAVGPIAGYPYGDVLQTDAATNPGNSGGPVFTLDGMIAGIEFMSRDGPRMGFAISAPAVRAYVQDLLPPEP